LQVSKGVGVREKEKYINTLKEDCITATVYMNTNNKNSALAFNMKETSG
jgi:hypothetical protein